MDLLAHRIKERLKIRKSCRAFGNEIDRVWPPTSKEQAARQERIEEIQKYARAHGWSVVIHDSGLQATFRKAE